VHVELARLRTRGLGLDALSLLEEHVQIVIDEFLTYALEYLHEQAATWFQDLVADGDDRFVHVDALHVVSGPLAYKIWSCIRHN